MQGQDRHKRRCVRSWSAMGTGRAAGADVRMWPAGCLKFCTRTMGHHE